MASANENINAGEFSKRPGFSRIFPVHIFINCLTHSGGIHNLENKERSCRTLLPRLPVPSKRPRDINQQVKLSEPEATLRVHAASKLGMITMGEEPNYESMCDDPAELIALDFGWAE
jgi:hypothetical protein